jgi:hypothetical protein
VSEARCDQEVSVTIHGSLFSEFKETTAQDPFALQNKKMLKIQMQYGPVQAKTGSRVAYQGDVRFQNRGLRRPRQGVQEGGDRRGRGHGGVHRHR